MTREKDYLKDLKSYFNRYVTFDYRAKGIIVGKGNLDYPGLPSLDVVLIVEGLTANLISIRQLCDQELSFNLNHSKRTFTYKRMEKIMKGTISSYNFYM